MHLSSSLYQLYIEHVFSRWTYSSEEPSSFKQDESEKQKKSSKAEEILETEQQLEPQVPTPIQGFHSSSTVRTSAQGFHSSVTEDNLDLSNRGQSDVNTNLVSSPSHKASSHKDLTLDQFSGTGMTNSDNDTYKYHNSKQLNVLSVSDKVLNLPLKNDEKLQEYQFTVKGKQTGDLTDDHDRSDSDNEKVLGESDTKRNIQLEYKSDSDNEQVPGNIDTEQNVQFGSNGNDSLILSEDADLFGDGPQTAGDLDKSDRNNQTVLGESDTERNVDVDSSGYDSKFLTEDTDLCEDGPQTSGK